MTACAPIVIVAHTNMSLVQGVKILRGNKGSELQHTKQGLQGQKFKKHNYLEGLGWPPNFSPSVPSLSRTNTPSTEAIYNQQQEVGVKTYMPPMGS